jgi:hypothetical protein
VKTANRKGGEQCDLIVRIVAMLKGLAHRRSMRKRHFRRRLIAFDDVAVMPGLPRDPRFERETLAN